MTDPDIPPSAAAREHSRGRIDAAPPEEFAHSGLVDDETARRLLSSIARYYDPVTASEYLREEHDREIYPEDLPDSYEDLDLYRRILRTHATDAAHQAVEEGNDVRLSYLTGKPDMSHDISGLGAIETLRERLIKTPAALNFIFGEPGSGKTNLALLLGELWTQEYPDGEVASNIRTWSESDRWIPRWPALDEWISSNLERSDSGALLRAEGADPQLFVFDEASSSARGGGKQGFETRDKMVPMLTKARKSNTSVIIIGHDGKDVHPSIRSMATIIERRRGEVKRATLYEDVVERSGRNEIMEIEGIPETSYTYDDKESSYWSWETQGEDPRADSSESVMTEEEIAELAEELEKYQIDRLAGILGQMSVEGEIDLSQSRIGEILGEIWRGDGYSQNWVSLRKRKLEEGEITSPREEL